MLVQGGLLLLFRGSGLLCRARCGIVHVAAALSERRWKIGGAVDWHTCIATTFLLFVQVPDQNRYFVVALLDQHVKTPDLRVCLLFGARAGGLLVLLVAPLGRLG